MSHPRYCAQFIPPSGKVLDVGSGKGKFVCAMAALGYDVFGIEINPEYVREAQERAHLEKVAAHLQEGVAERLPFENDSFDFLNCSEVTEHVENPSEVLREMFRVLKVGGYAYISFHNRFGVYDYHYHMWGINWLPRRWADGLLILLGKSKEDGVAGRQTLGGMHYFTYTRACELLKKCGFSVADIREAKLRQLFPRLHWLLRPVYKVFVRSLYFNTFHLLVQKHDK